MSEQNTIQDALEDYLKQFEQAAADVFETITDTFVGKAETLRDGTEFDPVSLPRDLAAHRNVLLKQTQRDGFGKAFRI